MKPRDHWDRLGQLGCCVCRSNPVQLHHAGGGSMTQIGIHKAKGMKNSDWLALPLCPNHHTGKDGIHSLGVHTWEAKFSEQALLLSGLGIILGLDLIGLAKAEKRSHKPYKRPSKVMAR